MKILLIADEEDKYLWDFYRPDCLDGVDLILSAGDLKPEYLRFLVTMANCPLVYVHGNHDGSYSVSPPEGCECADDRLLTVKGLRILARTAISPAEGLSIPEQQMPETTISVAEQGS